MESDRRLNRWGLTFTPTVIYRLRKLAIYGQPQLSLEHQGRAKRYVVRGVESGGASEAIGYYVTFAKRCADQVGAIAAQVSPRFQVHFPKMRLPGPDRLGRGSNSGKARHQFAVVDAGRTVRIYQTSSSLMPVGWSLMRPGLRNDALIVYNCR